MGSFGFPLHMEKVGLEIVGLSYSQTQSGAYALVLSEKDGSRKLPIIIGGFEAQAIAIELEKMTPSRPLTHDLFKRLTESFNIDAKEIVIYNLVEGVFYANIVFEQDGDAKEIDARTSDAVALAVRYNIPIYTFEFILSSAGILLDENEENEFDTSGEFADDEEGGEKEKETVAKSSDDFSFMSEKELEEKLQEAVDDENYELASKIRDELTKRGK